MKKLYSCERHKRIMTEDNTREFLQSQAMDKSKPNFRIVILEAECGYCKLVKRLKI